MKKLQLKLYSTCCNNICDSFIEKLEKLAALNIIDLEEINLYSNKGIKASSKYGIHNTMFVVVFDGRKEIMNFEGTRNIPQLIKNYIIMAEEKKDPIEETNPDNGEDLVVDDDKKTDGDKHRRFGTGGAGMPFVDKQLEQNKKIEEPKLEE